MKNIIKKILLLAIVLLAIIGYIKFSSIASLPSPSIAAFSLNAKAAVITIDRQHGHIITASDDYDFQNKEYIGNVSIYDLKNKNLIKSMNHPDPTIKDFSPYGVTYDVQHRRIYVLESGRGENDTRIQIYDSETLEYVSTMKNFNDIKQPSTALINTETNQIYVADTKGHLEIFNADNFAYLSTLTLKANIDIGDQLNILDMSARNGLILASPYFEAYQYYECLLLFDIKDGHQISKSAGCDVEKTPPRHVIRIVFDEGGGPIISGAIADDGKSAAVSYADPLELDHIGGGIRYALRFVTLPDFKVTKESEDYVEPLALDMVMYNGELYTTQLSRVITPQLKVYK